MSGQLLPHCTDEKTKVPVGQLLVQSQAILPPHQTFQLQSRFPPHLPLRSKISKTERSEIISLPAFSIKIQPVPIFNLFLNNQAGLWGILGLSTESYLHCTFRFYLWLSLSLLVSPTSSLEIVNSSDLMTSPTSLLCVPGAVCPSNTVCWLYFVILFMSMSHE